MPELPGNIKRQVSNHFYYQNKVRITKLKHNDQYTAAKREENYILPGFTGKGLSEMEIEI